MVLLLILRRVITNPMHLMINEVSFGEEAFVELKSILPDSILGKSMTDYHLLIAKRKNQGRRMNHLVAQGAGRVIDPPKNSHSVRRAFSEAE